ncbi:MAG: two-component sensor histidine kinase [Alphaproteobacteria bacterium]|nr:two-component sensor histidine kinase [Alphaproteobacteria bacterium]
MRPRRVLGAAGAIALIPALALIVLIAAGAAAPGPALAALAAVLAGALALALVWTRDTARLVAILRHAERGEHLALVHAAGAVRLPPLERLGRAIERFARALADRAAALEQRLRATETLLDRLPDPLLVLAADRSVRRANAAARAAFGADIPAVLRHPGLRAALDRALAQGGPQMGGPQIADLSLPVPVPREVQATVMVLDPPLADGGVAIAVLSDRSRERAVERMRADFVANASHELRTPLASLIGFIDTLRGPAADDKPAQERFLGIMAEQAQRMNRLIDDLLQLSRIELTEHQPPADLVAIGDLVARIAASFEPRLPARRMRLALDVAKGLAPVAADADQIEQVLQNLVDNALKYGREGGTVRVAAAPAATRPGVVLSVADDGPGIARAHLPRLTERFYRVDKGRSRARGGTGLGLAIVKHIVSRHRGQLTIESEEGKGTTFTVWLPAAPEREAGR